MAIAGTAPRRIDNCHAPMCAHRLSYSAQAWSPRRRGTVVYECFAPVISHLSVGVLAASSSPAPLSLLFSASGRCWTLQLCCGAPDLCVFTSCPGRRGEADPEISPQPQPINPALSCGLKGLLWDPEPLCEVVYGSPACSFGWQMPVSILPPTLSSHGVLPAL